MDYWSVRSVLSRWDYNFFKTPKVKFIVKLQIALILAAFMMAAQFLFSGYFVLIKDTSAEWHLIFELFFSKHVMTSMVSIFFGYNRERLECQEMYCHFQKPENFLNFIGVQEELLWPISALIIHFVLVHSLTFIIIRHRLRSW